MMNFNDYIVGIIAVGVYLICVILHSIKFIDNRWLPLIAGVLGIGFNIWYSKSVDFGIFVGGLASGLAAVGIDQGKEKIIDIFKNMNSTKKEEQKK